MLDGRRHGRSWTELAVEVEGMVPLINTPTVILATSEQVSRFPKVLAIVAHPDVSGPSVDRHAPWVAQAIRPELWTCIGPPNKRVVLGHRPGLVAFVVIDIDAQHPAQQIAQVLSSHPTVRVTRPIARRDIEQTVLTENQTPAVVTGRAPFDGDLLRTGITPWRGRTRHGEPRDAVCPFRRRRGTVAEHIKVTVRVVTGMEG